MSRSNQQVNDNQQFQTSTIVVMTKGFYMNNIEKAGQYSHSKAVKVQKLHFRFTTTTNRVKNKFIRVAAWCQPVFVGLI